MCVQELSCVRLFVTLSTVSPAGSSVHGILYTKEIPNENLLYTQGILLSSLCDLNEKEI